MLYTVKKEEKNGPRITGFCNFGREFFFVFTESWTPRSKKGVKKNGQNFRSLRAFSILKKHGDSESESRIKIGPEGPEIPTAPHPRCGFDPRTENVNPCA